VVPRLGAARGHWLFCDRILLDNALAFAGIVSSAIAAGGTRHLYGARGCADDAGDTVKHLDTCEKVVRFELEPHCTCGAEEIARLKKELAEARRMALRLYWYARNGYPVCEYERYAGGAFVRWDADGLDDES